MENIDFLPERIRNQRVRSKWFSRQVYLLAVFAGALALLALERQNRISRAEAELLLLTGRSANVQRQLAMLGTLESQQAELHLKKRINDHLGSRFNVMVVLAELERLMPASMALVNLHVETVDQTSRAMSPTVRPTARPVAAPSPHAIGEQTVKRLRLVITGVAPTDVDVANFIGQMATSRLFEEVTMGYAKNVSYRGRAAREFQATSYIVR
ncbi:MAG: hypothetical protein BWX88_04708 [Planctomycetes bacterium ADurb.Bin126]|nr:MAG: hypothetical protein BWX88_04708 [Planctomycetes bacterium ADurb.Bin126]HOD81712.1 PilN domain-containing protein [Phycisphaerae bacterium]HQL76514.1 PilN domain-containing protein [Phycisphaerae bacterium]